MLVACSAAVTFAAGLLLVPPASAQSVCTNLSSGGGQANGANSFACGPGAIVIGAVGNPADPVRGTAIGDNAQVIGNDGTAVGQYSYASTSSTALGSGSEAVGAQAVAIGTGDNNNINDLTNTYGARDNNATAVGFAAIAGRNSTAIGHAATAIGLNSVALGIGSVATVDNTVSVGSFGNERRIVNVATGAIAAGSTDAITGAQLMTANQRVAAAFGGGTSLDVNGQLTAPSYGVLGNTYNNLGGALDALNAQAVYFRSNSTGLVASATGADANAIGSGSTASGGNAIAVGSNARGTGANAVAIGTNSQATQSGAIAVGMNAASTGTNAIAIGTSATATGSVAVGARASAANGGAAFGDGAIATGTNATAVGPNSTATAANSVAVGSGSVASAPNTVSFGATGNERRLTNVAAGVSQTDAVNVGQLQSVAAGFQSQLGGLQTQINDTRWEARGGVALALAASGLRYDDRPGKLSMAGAVGHFKGESGLAFGVGYAANERLRFNASVSGVPSQGNVGGVVSGSLTLN